MDPNYHSTQLLHAEVHLHATYVLTLATYTAIRTLVHWCGACPEPSLTLDGYHSTQLQPLHAEVHLHATYVLTLATYSAIRTLVHWCGACPVPSLTLNGP